MRDADFRTNRDDRVWRAAHLPSRLTSQDAEEVMARSLPACRLVSPLSPTSAALLDDADGRTEASSIKPSKTFSSSSWWARPQAASAHTRDRGLCMGIFFSLSTSKPPILRPQKKAWETSMAMKPRLQFSSPQTCGPAPNHLTPLLYLRFIPRNPGIRCRLLDPRLICRAKERKRAHGRITSKAPSPRPYQARFLKPRNLPAVQWYCKMEGTQQM